jgi:hypothetical protein
MVFVCHNVVLFLHFNIVILFCQATIEMGKGKSCRKKYILDFLKDYAKDCRTIEIASQT